ncbi:MAG: RsmD family RNA methyltransferase [Lentisphaeria bacterium]|nr:RsmD family RNA methyltransferase [Lentisphaeria bacterium]
MALKIISGLARGIMLDTPPDRSMRPTSGRGREALFSSLGDISGKSFADIFAGSGAIGLEAASRGASSVTLLEANAMHVKLIEKNIAKLRKAGADCPMTAIRRKAIAGSLLALGRHDIWFFDPPYAESASYLEELLENGDLLKLWQNSLLIWEMPDTTEATAPFQQISKLNTLLDVQKRTLGNVDFLFCKVKSDL